VRTVAQQAVADAAARERTIAVPGAGQRMRVAGKGEGLDIAFREDEGRVRTGHAAQNLAILRRCA